jgi:signal transduction histidine kinase
VEMHKGIIKVKSRLGEGSEFIINLPIILVDEEYYEESQERKQILNK